MRVCLKPQCNALFEIRARYQWADTIPASMRAEYGELSSIIAAQYNTGLYASARLEIVPLGYQL